MPVDICGFLEISSLDEDDLDQDYAWKTCVDLSSLMLMTGDECDILFGESKYSTAHSVYSGSADKWPPLAKRRGTPHNMAYLTKQAVEEALHNDGAIMSTWGFTHISYGEIKDIEWQSYLGTELMDLDKSYSWGLLFKLMETLDNASKHQRLIVWFEWR